MNPQTRTAVGPEAGDGAAAALGAEDGHDGVLHGHLRAAHEARVGLREADERLEEAHGGERHAAVVGAALQLCLGWGMI